MIGGREYIAAPLSLIVPDSVLNGSKGRLFYPRDECKATVADWDRMPLVAPTHPIAGGVHVSANHPGILEKHGIGFVRKPHLSRNLGAIGYFDVENTRRVDARILESLENNLPIELSTGLFTDNEPAPPGYPYEYIARNYRPDHVAVLPDQIGACSLLDGCGVLNAKDALGHGSWTKVDRYPNEEPIDHGNHRWVNSETGDAVDLRTSSKFKQGKQLGGETKHVAIVDFNGREHKAFTKTVKGQSGHAEVAAHQDRVIKHIQKHFGIDAETAVRGYSANAARPSAAALREEDSALLPKGVTGPNCEYQAGGVLNAKDALGHGSDAHTMTRAQYVGKVKDPAKRLRLTDEHRQAVARAYSEGKHVPDEVGEDYPAMAMQAGGAGVEGTILSAVRSLYSDRGVARVEDIHGIVAGEHPGLSDEAFKRRLGSLHQSRRLVLDPYTQGIDSMAPAARRLSPTHEHAGTPAPVGSRPDLFAYARPTANARPSAAALREADFILLPKGVTGTNCLNCEYQAGGICSNQKLRGLRVTARNCCAYWDAEGAKRTFNCTAEAPCDT